MTNEILLADNQAITQAGLSYLLTTELQVASALLHPILSKADLTRMLLRHPAAIVVLDYTLSELNGSDELLIFLLRFPQSRWLLFSEDLSEEFLRRIIPSSPQVGVVLKSDSRQEILTALQHTLYGQRYLCSQVSNLLLASHASVQKQQAAHDLLTPSERSILREIALGKTTKEIAAERNLSFHTVNSHRKNIFRKLEVNNVHEATKYAMRAGIVDMAEYYI